MNLIKPTKLTTLPIKALSISCFAEFKVSISGFDKYTELEMIQGVGSWVKSDQGKRVTFDITTGNDSAGKTDHYLVLEEIDGFWEVFPSIFIIGDYMFPTINQSEKIKLPISILESKGSITSVSNATGKYSTYLNEETYNKLLNPSYVYFEIQGCQR